MDYYQIIAGRFQDAMGNIAMSVDILAEPIATASEQITQMLLQDGKVICCGNGADAALAQLFCASLLSRFEEDRPALPAHYLGGDSASLTAIANHESFAEIYSRQLRALGREGDVLLLINSDDATSSTQTPHNLVQALEAARERNMGVVLLSNTAQLALTSQLLPGETLIPVETATRSHCIELHTMILQSLCQLVEYSLFGYPQEQ